MKKRTYRRMAEAVLLLAAVGLVIAGLWAFRSSEAPGADGSAMPGDSLARISMEKMTPAPLKPLDGQRNVAEALDDASLAAQVKLALAEDARLERFRFDPEARAGRVTLWGNVQTRAQRRRAAEVAGAVEGVRSVANEVTVQGRSVMIASQEQGRSDTPGAAYHVVEPGETLWVIARAYGTTVERLKQLNDLRSSSLHPGDRLRVR